ncbi:MULTISPECIES: hypothetical protein [Streptomyces]|uniref:Uncharacterized protein n=1 Tax=Streptomyces chengmaiensis TaxID=3040919 RepID=A0ABT6HZ65_9ACTN|nr:MULTISPECIES: hypothetical protein [Streptomyces]MDH2393617.1 hypothetical protein [Streptomyces chengmaiensis]WRQ79322.1 hypothetical protein I3F59_008040 [Streptomyces sp. MUM 178J]
MISAYRLRSPCPPRTLLTRHSTMTPYARYLLWALTTVTAVVGVLVLAE